MILSYAHRALILAVAGVSIANSPALGGLMIYTDAESLPATWPASQAVSGGTLPVVVSGDNGATGSPNTTVFAPETVFEGKIEAETFTAPTTFNLGAISFVMQGSPDPGTNDTSIQLFELSGVYAPGTRTSSYQLGGTGGQEVGSELLGGGQGLSFTYGGGASPDVTEFDFTGSDQVQILAGQIYAIEIWDNSAGPTSFFMGRTINFPYTGGQVYADSLADGGGEVDMSTEARTGVGGGGPRNLLFAVYPKASVPEPVGAGLMVLGTMGLLGRRRGLSM